MTLKKRLRALNLFIEPFHVFSVLLARDKIITRCIKIIEIYHSYRKLHNMNIIPWVWGYIITNTFWWLLLSQSEESAAKHSSSNLLNHCTSDGRKLHKHSNPVHCDVQNMDPYEVLFKDQDEDSFIFLSLKKLTSTCTWSDSFSVSVFWKN